MSKGRTLSTMFSSISTRSKILIGLLFAWLIPLVLPLIFETTFTGWTGYAPLVQGGGPGIDVLYLPKTYLLVPLLLIGVWLLQRLWQRVLLACITVAGELIAFFLWHSPEHSLPRATAIYSARPPGLVWTWQFSLSLNSQILTYISVILAAVAVIGIIALVFINDREDNSKLT